MVESSSSPSANKRIRDPTTEDEAYLDNFHSHKRYLSEIMASSLNGLTVGESMPQNLQESPARSEAMSYLRDDVSLQYSPMSEDSDDAQYSETSLNTSMVPSDTLSTSQSSPHRHQRLLNGAMVTSYPSTSCNLTAVACSQPRQRSSDSEGRFPSSPSDLCHSPDLRRAALLRSVQMRVQPLVPQSYDLPSSPEQDSMQSMEAEDHPCSCGKSLVDDCVCQNQQQSSNLFAEECSSIKVSEDELNPEKSCKTIDMNVKEESCVESFESSFGRHDLMRSRRSILGGNRKAQVDSNK
ncbi:Ubiquitin carboxyl-terminal hydrolase [Thalictrum thalictroides]|uniref:Ubiquitin carboxyl-terminal hydrolase n=1 Tax=Thalictrum thalictroides TaxID=46969 RepID=A0A7J6W3A2_THATH|nr:Ubiquitin carboxyl-terminal hydrolase [Thalictrum thalictroides]